MVRLILAHYQSTKEKCPFKILNGDSVKVGDILRSAVLEDNIIVDVIISQDYNFINTKTGDLTTECSSIYCQPIQKIFINKNED